MVQYLFQLVNPSVVEVVDVVVVYDVIVVVVVKIKYNDEIQIKMRLHQYSPVSLPSSIVTEIMENEKGTLNGSGKLRELKP